MNNYKTKILLFVFVLLLAGLIISVVYALNIKNDDHMDTPLNEVVEATIEPTVDPLSYFLDKGKYGSEKVDSGFLIVSDEKSTKIIKNGETLLINSSLFNDDEKQRIIKNVLHNIESDKDKYNDLTSNQNFLNELSDFDMFFNECEFDNEYITLTHRTDNEVSIKIPYWESTMFINFMFNGKNISADQIELLKTTRVLDRDKPMIALTFDDGPSSENTIDIVSKLQEYNSVATFFVLGKNVERNKEIVNKVIESGCEIGGHSWDHKSLVDLDVNQIMFQYNSVFDVVKKVSDYEIKLYRPPYGAVNNRVRSLSPYPLIMWDIDTLDWRTRNENRIVNHVLDNVKDGSIILLHDIHKETKDATITLIPLLIEQGYQLVTVSELMENKEVNLVKGNLYYSARESRNTFIPSNN